MEQFSLLDIVSYSSEDYMKKNGSKRSLIGVIMGISKKERSIISPQHYFVVVSEDAGNIYSDRLMNHQMKLLRDSSFRDGKYPNYLENWPNKNAIFRIENDYGILMSMRLSSDTKKLIMELYSIENCPSLFEDAFESIDEKFRQSFIGFDDPILRDVALMSFRRKVLEENLDQLSSRIDISPNYSEYGKVKIYTIESALGIF